MKVVDRKEAAGLNQVARGLRRICAIHPGTVGLDVRLDRRGEPVIRYLDRAAARVTILASALLPRPHKNDPSKRTKKLYQQTVTLGTGRVLYAGKGLVFVEAFGCTSLFHASGRVLMWGYGRVGKKADLFRRAFDWRLAPESVEALRRIP